MPTQWIECKLEMCLKEKLKDAFPNNQAKIDSIYSDYISIRSKAIEISRNIQKEEPTLTDHSPIHIANVMDNAYRLVEENINSLNYAELYFLCVIIMLHDVGNIEGRSNHQNKVTEIYNEIRAKKACYNTERKHVLNAISAHSGEIKQGDKDTLRYLSESVNLLDNNLRLRDLASILRFADELAEGPQRTCDYLIKHGKYVIEKDGEEDGSALIYQVYANIVEVFIDKDRISISYDIDVKLKEIQDTGIDNLLMFVYKRIIKLDEERRYCKYYTHLLDSFKHTYIVFNINCDGTPIDIGIPDIKLEDKFNVSANPNNSLETFLKQYPQLEIESILNQIQNTL